MDQHLAMMDAKKAKKSSKQFQKDTLCLVPFRICVPREIVNKTFRKSTYRILDGIDDIEYCSIESPILMGISL